MNLDSIGNLQCRKLTGLAVANLLPVADVCVTSRFNSLVNMCVDVLHDVMDVTEQNQQYEYVSQECSERGHYISGRSHSININTMAFKLYTIVLHYVFEQRDGHNQ